MHFLMVEHPNWEALYYKELYFIGASTINDSIVVSLL